MKVFCIVGKSKTDKSTDMNDIPKQSKKFISLKVFQEFSQDESYAQYYLNGAGVATPDPGEAPPLAGFNMKSPLQRRNSGCLYLGFIHSWIFRIF